MNITLQSASLDMVELTLEHSFHREEEDSEEYEPSRFRRSRGNTTQRTKELIPFH